MNFINYNWISWWVTKAKEVLEKLSKNKELDKILNLEIIKKENKLFIKFIILPWYFNFTQKEKNKFFRNHFIDKKILTNSIKQNYFSLFFKAIRKVVCNNNIDEYSISNNEIKEKIWDTNLQRIKKNIKDISKNIWWLNISFVWKEIIFKKK